MLLDPTEEALSGGPASSAGGRRVKTAAAATTRAAQGHRAGWEKTKAAATNPKSRLSRNRVLGTATELKFNGKSNTPLEGQTLSHNAPPHPRAHLHFHDRHEVLPLLLQIEGRLGLCEERRQQAGLDARGPALAGHGFAQGGDIRSWKLTT